jgi:hypothetical protein
VSDISLEALGSSDPGETGTPNCADCSRGVAHRECSVLHLLDDGWVIEHGAHRDKPAVAVMRNSPGKAGR